MPHCVICGTEDGLVFSKGRYWCGPHEGVETSKPKRREVRGEILSDLVVQELLQKAGLPRSVLDIRGASSPPKA